MRWFDNFAERHGPASYDVRGGALHAAAPDGAVAEARLPVRAGATRARATRPRWPPPSWHRPGGACCWCARAASPSPVVAGQQVVGSKVGQRHVQGRTKAGGQSQQRFARRRDNQARQAYEAAADHAARVLAGPLDALVCGGDRSAVEAVLSDTRLAPPGARSGSRRGWTCPTPVARCWSVPSRTARRATVTVTDPS